MIEVGQKVLCVHPAINLFSRTPKYNDVLKVTDVSGTLIKVEGYKNWYNVEDFAIVRGVPDNIDDVKAALGVACEGWEYFYQVYGEKYINSAFGLLKVYVDSLSEDVKSLREEVKELKEKVND